MKKQEIIEMIKKDAVEYDADVEAKIKEFETLGRVEFYRYGKFCTHYFKRYIPINENKFLIKSWTDSGIYPTNKKQEIVICE